MITRRPSAAIARWMMAWLLEWMVSVIAYGASAWPSDMSQDEDTPFEQEMLTSDE
jgi:hypothetical protein